MVCEQYPLEYTRKLSIKSAVLVFGPNLIRSKYMADNEAKSRPRV